LRGISSMIVAKTVPKEYRAWQIVHTERAK
jgi:hypothetical protein